MPAVAAPVGGGARGASLWDAARAGTRAPPRGGGEEPQQAVNEGGEGEHAGCGERGEVRWGEGQRGGGWGGGRVLPSRAPLACVLAHAWAQCRLRKKKMGVLPYAPSAGR